MSTIAKSRSPSYPSKSLEWAVNAALCILEKQGTHALPHDVVAQSLSYKSADSGPARQAIATLKSYGILTKDGKRLRLNSLVQRYKLALTEDAKTLILNQWFVNPLLFSNLLDKYENELPTSDVIVHDLVLENSFTEKAARKAASIIKESAEFANLNAEKSNEQDVAPSDIPTAHTITRHNISSGSAQASGRGHVITAAPPVSTDFDRYPIRLTGGRMAHIEVPKDFYNKDKEKLKAQLSIIGTVDEDDE